MTKHKNKNQLRVGIIGMGPIGCTLAAHLIEAGAFVVPCDIDSARIDKLKSDGIHLENVIQKHVKVTHACSSLDELKEYDLDLVAISVKTPSLKIVLTQLKNIASDRMYVMCTQNGMDNELEVAKIFGEEKTLRMVVNYAGNVRDLNVAHLIFFNPPNYIAPLSPNGSDIAQKITELLNVTGLKTEIPGNIQNYIWEKAILNAALSPVCAITGKTMKEVMDSPDGFQLVEAILDESVRIADAEGIRLPENFRDFSIKYLKSGGYHKPSMLVDIENGLPTEIDFLNGKIAEYGDKHDLAAPYCKAITAFVHLMEQKTK